MTDSHGADSHESADTRADDGSFHDHARSQGSDAPSSFHEQAPRGAESGEPGSFADGIFEGGGTVASSGEATRKKRRRRSRGSKAAASKTDKPAEPEAEAPPEGSGRASSAAGSETAGKKKRRRRRRTRRDDQDEPKAGEPAGDESEAPSDADGGAGDGEESGGTRALKTAKRRSRGRRGRGRGGSSSTSEPRETEGDASDETDSEDSQDSQDSRGGARDREAAPKKTKRRRRSRRKRGGDDDDGPVGVEVIPGEDDDLEEIESSEQEDDGDDEGSGGRRGRRGRRSKSSAGGGDGASSRAASGKAAKKKRTSRKKSSDDDESTVPARKSAGVPNKILVNASDREEVRVAVAEGTHIVDFQMNVRRHKTLVNDIYRGRVVNLEPAIGAAFIDFGQGRNGFLHTSDVMSVYGDPDFSISKVLTVQVDPEEWAEGQSVVEGEARDVEAEVSESDDGGEDDEAAEEAEASPRRGAKKSAGRGAAKRGRNAKAQRRSRVRPRLPITDLLKKGQSVVVQITKDAIGDKGPTLTTYISIPGRFLVLMPSMARTGVSRKIEDEKERRRLKKALAGLKNLPEGMGVIVRTAGTGCTQKDLQRDLDYILAMWSDFTKRLEIGRGPAPLYEESDVAIRTVRDLFSDSTEAVVVDDQELYDRVVEFTERLMPEKRDVVQLHDGPRPLFHTAGIEQDFERIFARRIDLPAGGSIVIDQAEALVAIDVNSGKTRSDGHEFEDVALKTNLEAAVEIARQIRLRDLGGILVLDFIDMMRSSSRRQVERALRDALALDRARSKLGRISQFGLLEMTRQRLGPGLSRMLFTNCPVCRGSGRIRTVESRAAAILRRLGSALTLKGFSKVEVKAVPEVIDYLKRNCQEELTELCDRSGRELQLSGVEGQLEDSVLRYLRQDGREVRPGGRRKR